MFRAASLLLLVALGLGACSQEKNKATASLTSEPQAPAVGPDGPPQIKVDPIAISTAPADVDKGKAIFTAKGCPACHRADAQKLVGPGLQGVTARRTALWLERMIIAPDVMVKEDPVAKGLLATHFTPMTAQGVDPKTELPALLAYLKSLEK